MGHRVVALGLPMLLSDLSTTIRQIQTHGILPRPGRNRRKGKGHEIVAPVVDSHQALIISAITASSGGR